MNSNSQQDKVTTKICSSGKKYTFIDLFAGAGGLSEGFIQAGFEPVAHVEMNEYAARTLETRAAFHYLEANDQLNIYHDYLNSNISRDALMESIPPQISDKVICKTMSEETLPEIYLRIDQLMTATDSSQIDVIIGGPPCQAYSIVGRAQSNHMETPMHMDPRNDLYKLYADFLERYQPRMFIFENVMGITSANGGETWNNIQARLKDAGYEIDFHEQNSMDFGVLQNRKRMVIVGWREGSRLKYPNFNKFCSTAIVNDLFSDLPSLYPGESSSEYKSSEMSAYVRQNQIRLPEDVLTLHTSRPNKDRDISIYKRTIELWNDGGRRLNYNDLPDELKTHKNRKSFLDRFKVVEGNKHYCHTMLAHISKDGHYFIHPDIKQHRSLTVREAARIQSFPDSYYFEGPRTAQFTQIGNAVPPLMAKGIAKGIAAELGQED